MIGVALFIAGMVLVVASTMWSGHVLSVLWGWFIVPIFHAPTLTVAQAIGVMLVVSVFKNRRFTQEEREETHAQALNRTWPAAFLLPLFLLVVGAIVKGFLP